MGLFLNIPEAEALGDGWGVIGEKIGDATTEELIKVFPTDERDEAKLLADHLEDCSYDGKSWLVGGVALVGAFGDGVQYVESSDLTYRGQHQQQAAA